MHRYSSTVSTGNYLFIINEIIFHSLQLFFICFYWSLVCINELLCSHNHVRLFRLTSSSYSRSSIYPNPHHRSSDCSNGRRLYGEYRHMEIQTRRIFMRDNNNQCSDIFSTLCIVFHSLRPFLLCHLSRKEYSRKIKRTK